MRLQALWASFASLCPLLMPPNIYIASTASNTTRPNCLHECGGVSIPYPFGIGDNCSMAAGFDNNFITCNASSAGPPRPYLLGQREIISLTLADAEMHVHMPVSYICFNSTLQSSKLIWFVDLYPLLVSPTKNKFTALGCNTIAKFSGVDNGSFSTGCLSYCSSESEIKVEHGKDCAGLGCCETEITTNISSFSFNFTQMTNDAWSYSPCSYTFVADKTWGDFSKEDVVGNMTFMKRVGDRGVPAVFDWAIRNNTSSCLTDGSENRKHNDKSCVSVHSYCVNATNGPGYFCKCSSGYAGNPYVPDGCKNVNECDPSIYEEKYPCTGGTCHDTIGGFECKCNFGRKRDSKDVHVCRPVLAKQTIVAIATMSAISVLSILLVFLHMKYEKRKLRYAFNKNGGQILKNMGIKILRKKDMDKITNNYSTMIGKGGFGFVYMGTTDNKQKVAVKCPNPKTVVKERQQDFANELIILSQISHKNVVKLLGCCLETSIPILVYEFVPRGSLDDVLHGKSNDSNVTKHTLSLQARLEIAIESAEALYYMHSSANQKILHGDVKSSNILLDEKFLPKVSDFGISRLLSLEKHHTNFVIGDANYMDPVYMKTGLLTEKSDVYGFGVVLLELITGKKARYDGNKSLPLNFVKSYMTESRAREMFDEEIARIEAISCLEIISRIAVQCLEEDVDKRPTMKEVSEHLHFARTEWMQRQGNMSCDQADETAIEFPPPTH